MSIRFAMAFAVLLTCSWANMARAQDDVVDLSKDPRLQQTIDLHLKRVLIPELNKALKASAKQQFVVSPKVPPLMVCVFAEKEPLWKVMKGVADVLGCQWRDLKTEWFLDQAPVTKKNLDKYVALESRAQQVDVWTKAKALTDLVQNQKWSGAAGQGANQTEEDDPYISPDEWARRRISDPAFYTAGLMFWNAPVIPGIGLMPRGGKYDTIGDFLAGPWAQAYRLDLPENEQVARTFMRSAPDPERAGLVNTQIGVRALPWAGTFQAILVDHGARRAPKPKYLLPYAWPKGELAKTAEGKWLLDWETPLKESKDESLAATTGSIKLDLSPFEDHQYGLEDYLEAAHNSTKKLIVSDGFRMPVIDAPELMNAMPLGDWLQTLRKTQKCFVKVADGMIEVRHGGFWDLRQLEPPESEIRAMESVKDPDLNDYADFAYRVGHETFYCVQPPAFFDTKQIPLLRFSSKPLRDSYNILMAYAQMSREARLQVLTGGVFDVMHYDFADHSLQSAFVGGRDRSGRTTVIPTNVDGGPVLRGTFSQDTYLWASCVFGVFFGAKPVGLETQFLESMTAPQGYLALSGRDPLVNPEFVRSNGLNDNTAAHLLFLLSPPFNPTDFGVGKPKVLYGQFQFLSGISRQDGAINELVIPGPSGN